VQLEMTDLPLHGLPLGFWLTVENPGFITRDDPLQKIVTFFAIMSQVVGTNV
jgi:hypothetical protein